ncbi:MAG: DUF2339 domain-containing protein [Gordonia sp. (in: high G+C Gram-positive bacteria)]
MPRPRLTTAQKFANAADEGLIGKILAGLGVAVTLIGVISLLVMANDSISHEVRVILGGVLAVVLLAAGAWYGRSAAFASADGPADGAGKKSTVTRAGAVGLAATGLAAGLLDVVAAANGYHLIPPLAGLALVGVITAVGYALAHYWNSQTLGVIVGVALLAFSPIVNTGFDVLLAGFLLAYCALTTAVQYGRDWKFLFAVNAAVSTFPLVILSQVELHQPVALVLILVIVNSMLITGAAMMLAPTSSRPELAAIVSAIATLITVPDNPFFPVTDAAAFHAPTWALLLTALALTVLMALAAFAGQKIPGVTESCRIVWLCAALLIPVYPLLLQTGRTAPIALAGIGVAVSLTGRFTGQFTPVLRAAATAWTVLSVLVVSGTAVFDSALDSRHVDQYNVLMVVLGSAAAIVAVIVVAMDWVRLLGIDRALPITIVAGLICLGLFTLVSIGIGLLAGGADGFRVGHTVATVVYATCAGVLMAWARRLRARARMITLICGLTLIAFSVAKLFLFDLAALPGVYRVLAFTVVGLILLALGVVYSRTLPGAGPQAPWPGYAAAAPQPGPAGAPAFGAALAQPVAPQPVPPQPVAPQPVPMQSAPPQADPQQPQAGAPQYTPSQSFPAPEPQTQVVSIPVTYGGPVPPSA